MSLINDALKKAQKQRADEAAAASQSPPPGATAPAPSADGGGGGGPAPASTPAPVPAAASRPPMTRKPPGRSGPSVMLLGVGGIVLVAASVAITIFLLRDDRPAAPLASAAPAAARPNPVAPASATANPAPTAQTPAPAVPAAAVAATTTPAAASTAPGIVFPAAAGSAPASTAAASTPHPAPPIASTTAPAPAHTSPSPADPAAATSPAKPLAVAAAQPVAAPIPAPPADTASSEETAVSLLRATPTEAPKPNLRIQAFVDKLRINGIRISNTGGKALLNDRLFREGDLVEPSLSLKLTKIEQNLLTFTDSFGFAYLRRF